MEKPARASKTIIMNILVAIAAVSGAVGIDIGLTPEVQAQIAVGVVAVANIAMRFITRSGIRGLL